MCMQSAFALGDMQAIKPALADISKPYTQSFRAASSINKAKNMIVITTHLPAFFPTLFACTSSYRNMQSTPPYILQYMTLTNKAKQRNKRKEKHPSGSEREDRMRMRTEPLWRYISLGYVYVHITGLLLYIVTSISSQLRFSIRTKQTK